MNNKHCGDVLENLALYVGGELGAADSRIVAEHLVACERCSAQYEEVRRLFGLLESDAVELPGERDWRRLADEAFIKWRDESRNAIKPPAAYVPSWAAALRSLLTPVIKPVLATAAALFAVAVFFLGGNADIYSRADFYARHISGSVPDEVLKGNAEIEEFFVMGFSYQPQPGSFVLGVEYARAHQACTFAFERECEDRVRSMNRILAGYPHAVFEEGAGGYFADKGKQLEMLKALQNNIKQSISPLEAEYFLYQFGNWTQDMNLAVAMNADTIVEERGRAGEFLRQAEKLNLARGVIEALTDIETILSHERVAAQDYKSLKTRLADIYTILI